MKVNKITFDKINARWNIMKMTSAYINAEKILIQQTAVDIEQNNDTEISFIMDNFGNSRQLTPKEVLKIKLDAFELQGTKLLEEEKYELFAELKELYEKYKQEYDRL
jgi:hypothetical protein